MIDVALGIDIGTGSTKAGLMDRSGRLLAVGRCSHRIDEPRPGWSQSDPSSWLDSAATAISRAKTTAENETVVDEPVEIVAVGFSGQMHGVVACDGAGDPVRPAVLWSDRRSQPDLARLRDRLGPDGLALLGNPVVAGMAGPTVAALRREEPSVMAGTSLLLQPKDWVRSRLTGTSTAAGGPYLTDPSDASATLLWDTVDDRWSPHACSALGVEPRWLPEVVASDAAAGTVSAEGAALFGLVPGLSVAVGAADTAAALLGAGLRSGEVQLSTGTGGQIARLTDRAAPTSGPTASRSIHRFRAAEVSGRPEAPRWYEMAAIQNAGIAIDWALGVLGLDLAGAAEAVEQSPIGANGVTFLPYLTGERTPHLNADLCGGWTGLRPTTTAADLARSVFEGVAFALCDGLDALLPAGDGHEADRPDRLLLAGGGSTAGWWQQMLADVLRVPLVPHNATDASVRGAGLLAWSCIGVRIDPGAGVQRSAPVTPCPADADRYGPVLSRFRRSLGAAGGAEPLTDGPGPSTGASGKPPAG